MLRLVNSKKEIQVRFEDQASARAHEHHHEIMDGFFQSHRIRNHSTRTLKKNEMFLKGWFDTHGDGQRPLYTWEAMRPVEGRKRVVAYGKALLDSEITNHTIRSYLGTLRSYFQYVLEHPFVSGNEKNESFRITQLYGSIEQPVSEYDIPQHSHDDSDTRRGIPLDPEKLYDFYAVLKNHYLTTDRLRHVRARNYAMVVLAGESGLRADELSTLEINKDLFFESKKLQTRNAKASRGSGKRTRVTLFTPLARDTIRYYLSQHRPHLGGASETDFLFPSRSKLKRSSHIHYSPMAQALRDMVSLANKNGLPVSDHFGWHWFRRIFATRFIERFPNQLSVLMSLMGHSSPSTIHAYIHHSQAWMDTRIQEVMEKVEFDEY